MVYFTSPNKYNLDPPTVLTNFYMQLVSVLLIFIQIYSYLHRENGKEDDEEMKVDISSAGKDNAAFKPSFNDSTKL